MVSVSKSIQERIENLGAGVPLTHLDFIDIAPRETVKLILSRLNKSGKIVRLMRGIYTVPRYSDFLKQEILPAPGDVVQVIAKNNGWNVIPSGENALNVLGLSTQVPARYEYLSSGPYKKYLYGDVEIILKRRANRDLVNKSYKSMLVIQALKALGQQNIDQSVLYSLKRVLSKVEIAEFLIDTQTSPSWIFEIARTINRGEIDEECS